MSDMKQLFDTVRDVKGAPLTQDDVNRINAALGVAVATAHKSGMKTSAKGVSLIHSFETCKLSTYKDPGSKDGLPITGGWGTTRDHNGKPFKLGFTANQAYWDRLFARDLANVETGVNILIDRYATTQSQFDALVSFAYNVGLDMDGDGIAEGLGDSTLLKRHRAGNYAAAKAEFAKWNKNDGVVMRGLTRRREAEAALYASA